MNKYLAFLYMVIKFYNWTVETGPPALHLFLQWDSYGFIAHTSHRQLCCTGRYLTAQILFPEWDTMRFLFKAFDHKNSL